MITRLHIAVLLILALIVWALTLLVLGVPYSWEHAKPYGVTLAVLTALATTFERFMWTWWIFKGWLVKRPYIQGTWKARLLSDYIDPATGKVVDPIDGILVIRQTLTTLSVRLFTSQSSSYLVGHKIVALNDGIFELVGVYHNEPQVHLRGATSEIHYGAMKLSINGDPPRELSGHYWTDRGTRGTMECKERKSRLASSFAEAQSLRR